MNCLVHCIVGVGTAVVVVACMQVFVLDSVVLLLLLLLLLQLALQLIGLLCADWHCSYVQWYFARYYVSFN
jgi:hypothetical protein